MPLSCIQDGKAQELMNPSQETCLFSVHHTALREIGRWFFCSNEECSDKNPGPGRAGVFSLVLRFSSRLKHF